MAKIIAERISSRYFTWDKKNSVFSTEASVLPSHANFLSQVYDDACDVGFVLVSHKTGEELVFIRSKTDKDYEGEIQGWWFELSKESRNKFPNHPRYKALIIND